jgi:thiol-disulfide isomerase/thioredoxin
MQLWTTLAAALALQAPAAAPGATAKAEAAPSAPTKTKTTTFTPVSDADYAAAVVAPHRGKVVLVNFWASYCLPCLEEIPALRALAAEKKKDLSVVFVSTDEPGNLEHLQKVIARRKLDLDQSFIVSNEDPEPFIRMIDDVWQGEMPYTVIYDREGKPIKKLPGAHSAAEFKAAVAEVAAAGAKK